MAEYNYENKKDKGKLRMDLIPPEALEGIAEVLTFGAEKYGENSWRKVEKERYIAALLRHYAAYMKDHQSVDEESGILHIKHLLCNAVFLMCFAVEDENHETR
jgi:hypothetical protein